MLKTKSSLWKGMVFCRLKDGWKEMNVPSKFGDVPWI